ncbi:MULTISPECIES: penicillin-insensitive murein endopeptidase [unclassified Rhizobium]|uniref:penicillin-insensitive murein endopeptidase n=1 Tax=unclassified Rhizobium TaxID=2613769 RepID=UPI000BC4581B|nr:MULTISPECIES: penicillin-insensitive murein endopeptidase [unclassified Rhizobium]MDH7809537.1 hypothetical protein [Rhizobium sp. AN67]MDQ4408780.1 penicillin-insensitive murein endopeptidase [Rhizobium sp. AN63]SOD50480.1 Penicillin-insensitive murein endopeptidase [Rhizobium sp. AN6A]
MSKSAISSTILPEFIPEGKRNRPGTRISPTSITIHNTDNTNRGANAKAHSRFVRETGYYEHNGKIIWVSWHFTVDDTHVIQHLPLNEVGYHAGSNANGSSIAIEICMNSDNDQERANSRAVGLVASLLRDFGWDVDQVKRHKDWTGKNCPSLLMSGTKWKAFLKAVSTELSAAKATVELDPEDVKAAQGTWKAPTEVGDFDIDHDALKSAIDASFSNDIGLSDQTSFFRANHLFESVISTLADRIHGGSLLFPHGINDISLDISPAGFRFAVKGPASSGIAAEDAAEHEDTVPDENFDADIMRALPPITSDLRDSSSVYGTHRADRRYGIERTIEAVNRVAERFHDEFGIRVGIGDISKEGGGPISGHDSHQKGVDVDVRVPRHDDREEASNFRHSSYSRQRTQRLVELFRTNGIFRVKFIFFNDPQVHGVSYWKNHDNHLHVRFDIDTLHGEVA